MGKSGSGKTSMRSIIFANYLARDTMRLGPTIGTELSDVKFLGNLVLNLWDCGGQDAFMENYFQSQRDSIFRNVEVLIYVFDIESVERSKDLHNFYQCLEAVHEYSKDAQIFCLIHKMDLHWEEVRQKLFEDRARELTTLAHKLCEDRAAQAKTPVHYLQITCFGTSIWDETLYKAWSAIVYSLVPNVEKLKSQLSRFCNLAHADEVVLFEMATFLVISSADDPKKKHADVHRHEKISNIIKQFKLSCIKSSSNFQSMEVKNQHFTAFLDNFTNNTYILIVMSNPKVQPAATHMNIQVARTHFEYLISSTS